MFSFLYPVFFCWNICFMGELIRPSSSPSLPRLFFSLLFSSVASKRAVPKWCYRKFRNPRMSKVMQVLLIFSSLFPIVKFVELYLFKFFFSLFLSHFLIILSSIPNHVGGFHGTRHFATKSSKRFIQFPNHEHKRLRTTGEERHAKERATESGPPQERFDTTSSYTSPTCTGERMPRRPRPPSATRPRGLAGCLSGRPPGMVVLTLILRLLSPHAMRLECILYPFSIAFICRRKRPMLHGHLHTLVNIGVEGFYIITGSFEKDRRKGYISPGECAVAFYVVIIE